MSQITGITRIKKTRNDPWNMWMKALGQGMTSFANAASGQRALDQQNSFNQQYMDMMNRMYPQAGGGGAAGVTPQQYQPVQGPQVDDGAGNPYRRNIAAALSQYPLW